MITPVPLREPTFLILTALAREPMHGYGIVTEVAALSDGRLTLRPGTLYGALDRLTDEGLVEPDREEIVGGRLRRYYRLTETGGSVLAAETERLRRNVEAASRRLRDRAAGTTPGSAAAACGSGVRPASAVRLAGGPA
ncbi:PadR family transcriptional regulator [Plantactinospora sp. KLBMP9567]|uniref:PadR family transcriptional regulator n=1 Tax=Plantactinospora sp. KLBMP9567 TaxID=3085900 RepID=UPI002982B396|nr:helix-turn-helix transcriptional regulator [Plantactinospora sp. KLBMP9567]MDW5322914.1 helix-turn-helix transcriptional regulator [Plantactinospora sp. KLBMP9567]